MHNCKYVISKSDAKWQKRGKNDCLGLLFSAKSAILSAKTEKLSTFNYQL